MDGVENLCSSVRDGVGIPSLENNERLIPAHLSMLDEKECFSSNLSSGWHGFTSGFPSGISCDANYIISTHLQVNSSSWLTENIPGGRQLENISKVNILMAAPLNQWSLMFPEYIFSYCKAFFWLFVFHNSNSYILGNSKRNLTWPP